MKILTEQFHEDTPLVAQARYRLVRLYQNSDKHAIYYYCHQHNADNSLKIPCMEVEFRASADELVLMVLGNLQEKFKEIKRTHSSTINYKPFP